MILLIESGSTKTAWRYITQLNESYESFYSAGINPYYQTLEEIKHAQAEALLKIEKFSPRFVYYFGTGITDETKKAIIEAVLRPVIGNAELLIQKKEHEHHTHNFSQKQKNDYHHRQKKTINQKHEIK